MNFRLTNEIKLIKTRMLFNLYTHLMIILNHFTCLKKKFCCFTTHVINSILSRQITTIFENKKISRNHTSLIKGPGGRTITCILFEFENNFLLLNRPQKIEKNLEDQDSGGSSLLITSLLVEPETYNV